MYNMDLFCHQTSEIASELAFWSQEKVSHFQVPGQALGTLPLPHWNPSVFCLHNITLEVLTVPTY